MKRNDYINIQAPMIADLHLKGNELLVFALIHGYTKDGKSKCRVSLNYMANWLCTGKSAVIKVINTLEEAGYINRHEYMEGMVRCVEYTTNYEYLLDQVSRGVEVSLESVKKSRGVKLTPATERIQIGGCQNDTGVKLTTKSQFRSSCSNIYLPLQADRSICFPRPPFRLYINFWLIKITAGA